MNEFDQELTEFAELSATKSFLGQEFLTWLWYTIEDTGGEISLQSSNLSNHALELWVDHKITLESAQANVKKQSLRGGQPSASLEATAALVSGKFVTELSLGLTCETLNLDCTLSLLGKDLSPRNLGFNNVKAPKTTNSPDTIEHLEKRATSIALVIDIIDDLFGQFIERRVNKSWEDQSLDQMRDWIHSRSQENLH